MLKQCNRFCALVGSGVALAAGSAAAADVVRQTWTVTDGSAIVQADFGRVRLDFDSSSLEFVADGGLFREFIGGMASARPVVRDTRGANAPSESRIAAKSSVISLIAVPQDGYWRLDTRHGAYDIEPRDYYFDASEGTLVLDGADLLESDGTGPFQTRQSIGQVILRFSAQLVDETVITDAPPADGEEQPEGGCTPSTGPDVIVGALPGTIRWGASGGITAYSVGTTSCNIGSVNLNWIAGTNQHPVISQNMYRLKTVDGSGRFEHIGQSWLKHGFTALTQNLCCTCSGQGGSVLGVGCSDPYCASLNGGGAINMWNNIGPKFEVNASTGAFPMPYGPYPGGNVAIIGKRLQVHNTDLDPAMNVGAQYFVEGHYIAADDAAIGNDNNNASYRKVTVGASPYNLTLVGNTFQQEPALNAWAANETGVIVKSVDVAGDGRLHLGYKATDLGGGQWHYEYAVYNYNSDRSAQSFSIPIPNGVNVTNIGFHDVDYHSGAPYVDTNWGGVVSGGSITWSCQTVTQNVNANAVRWATLYNFRFDANSAPQMATATIGLFKAGISPSVTIAANGPQAVITNVNIVSANPPLDNPFVPGTQPFTDVLQTGTTPSLTEGIGALSTPDQDTIVYDLIEVTFSAAPTPAPSATNAGIACTGGSCPTIMDITGAGTGPYFIELSGPIPPGHCTTLTFAGTNAGQKVQYRSLPGDVNYSGTPSATDLAVLVGAINNGQASLPSNLPRYNTNRNGPVSATDLSRLVFLLNGINTTQAWAGVTVAACP